MKLTFVGGVGEVTGSSHLLETPAGRMIIDCGMFQGHRLEAAEKNQRFPFNPRELHSVVLSHAHIDHSGRLPLLHSRGFNGNVYMTSATRDLAAIMLRDSAHIQQADVDYINKKRARTGEEPVPPLYTISDATRVLRHFVSIDYGRRFLPLPDVTATYYDAGHILGSALVRLDINQNAKAFTIGYACDLGRNEMPILRDPQPVLNETGRRLDALLIETTYGGRHHDRPEDMKAELADLVSRVVQRSGKLIIPAFSVGRTQNLLYYLHQLFAENRIPSVPVFVDSPLSVNATDIFRMHPECYDQATADFVEIEGPVFTHSSIHYVKSLAESKALNKRRKPAIIISASGMCEAGRILHHLKNTVTKPRNAVAIVGFMAENTLGRRLVERRPSVKIFGQMYPVRCEIATLNGLSAHADHDGILAYVDAVASPDTRIFLIHGEEAAAAAVSAALAQRGYKHVTTAQPGMTVDLG
ncbi:MAG: MBL fold metallo-hydrolase [Planctomycetota bacterium]|nr:MBL fold metallo-hydrolase [Planctomycetota bacterium]